MLFQDIFVASVAFMFGACLVGQIILVIQNSLCRDDECEKEF